MNLPGAKMVDTSTLDARVSKLGKASQRAAVLSLLGFLAVLGALGYASWELRDLERQIQERKSELVGLEALGNGLRQANEQLSATVHETTPDAAARPEITAAENARYAVGVYGYGVSQKAYERLRGILEEEGYTVVSGSLLESRASWLSRHCTVLYYDEKRREKAKTIADELSKATGVEFVPEKGAGLGVLPGQEQWSFFVHYVGIGS